MRKHKEGRHPAVGKGNRTTPRYSSAFPEHSPKWVLLCPNLLLPHRVLGTTVLPKSQIWPCLLFNFSNVLFPHETICVLSCDGPGPFFHNLGSAYSMKILPQIFPASIKALPVLSHLWACLWCSHCLKDPPTSSPHISCLPWRFLFVF